MVQRTGNHGIVIPRDKRLLARLYWVEEKTQTQIGEIFNTNHRSVGNVLSQLGIPIRQGPRRKPRCVDCGEKPMTKIHPIHGYAYGKRCEKHHKAHRFNLYLNWHYSGPHKPKDEKQWLQKSKVLLRNAQRACSAAPKTRKASLSQNEVSRLVQTSLL